MPIRYQAAKAGLGAAYLPCWLGDSDPDLVQVVKPEGDLIEDVFLVMHRRSRDRESVQRVAAALADLFRRHRKALVGVV
jgi:DNA-binding transcriptional LysR family regulator